MMTQEFRLPDLGEGIHEAEIIDVCVSAGQAVREDESILQVETDKAVVDTTWKVSCNLLNLRKQFTEGFFSAVFVSP
jgi:pyruvate dehydrogenase E2 component (dihydrolipoamide acetyltransferase)